MNLVKRHKKLKTTDMPKKKKRKPEIKGSYEQRDLDGCEFSGLISEATPGRRTRQLRLTKAKVRQ